MIHQVAAHVLAVTIATTVVLCAVSLAIMFYDDFIR